MEIGTYTFAELPPHSGAQRAVTSARRLRKLAEKILSEHEVFGHQRFLGQISVGTLPHDRVKHAIELLGTVVARAVREGP